eukprot:m.303815 g.303815  ORF g.303815 m.303815 type:complete len:350 (-) comp20170_c0_seq14:1849-2898(-)
MDASVIVALAKHREVLENGGFSKHLQLEFNKDTVFITADGWLEVRYEVPKSLCSTSSYHQQNAAESGTAREDACLPLCTVLALFDDISTYSIILADRTQRAGASLSLDARMLGPSIKPGEEVIFRSFAAKVGKVVGFADCQVVRMVDNEKEVIAEGRHVKYLPMGILWDCAFRWVTLERVLGMMARMRGTKHSSSSSDAPDSLEVFPVRVVYTEDGDAGDTGATRVSGTVVSGPQHANPFGNAHGGWIACVLEAVARAAVDKHVASPVRRVELVQTAVSYMAPVPAVAVVTATCASIRGENWEGQKCALLSVTTAVQQQQRSGEQRPRVAATASMVWRVHTAGVSSAHM